MRSTSSQVPTGTVDFTATTVKPLTAAAMSRAAWRTYWRSARPPSPSVGGVPTAMNTTSASRTADVESSVNASRPAPALAAISACSPGS